MDKIQMVANHGQKVKYSNEVIGVNSRLDTLQAGILKVKLKYLNEYTELRNVAAGFYDQQLSGMAQVEIPARATNSTHVFHQYTLKVKQRNELKTYLEGKGIPTMIYYPIPLHFQKAHRQSGVEKGSFPVSEKLSEEVLSLPIHTEMRTGQQQYVCNAIKEFYHE